MDFKEVVDAFVTCGVPPERQREGLELVRKLLGNILSHPQEAKYRQVKKSNAAIQSKLFPQCVGFLVSAGFEDSAEMLVYRREPGPMLAEVLAVVESLLSSFPSTAASSSSAAAPPPAPTGAAGGKATAQQVRQEKARQEAKRAQASAQEQLAALRQQRSGQYLQQQDRALAQHLSGRDADAPFDPIAALNASRGATHSFVTCQQCGASLRYNSATRAQAVLCPCGRLLQPLHLRGQAFAPRAPSDLPVEPGEPVDGDNRPRAAHGPYITVRGSNGETSRLPLHSVLQMVRHHEESHVAGAREDTIEALPTRKFVKDIRAGLGPDDSGCQICMEDFEEGDELRTLPCFHLFHAKCIDQWLKEKSVCPTCRHKVG